MTVFEEIAAQVVNGDSESVSGLVQEALSKNHLAEEVLKKGLVVGMGIVSERFKNNECFIPEVLVSARAMNAGLDILNPLLTAAKIKARGKVVIGTVKGDLHDIGKNIVAMMLKGAGFEVIDLGADVPKEKFIEAVQTNKVNLVGMSALLTTTMIYMKEVIEALKSAGLKNSVKVIVGGAPLTEDYALKIEADGYSPDAASAVDLAKNLLVE